MKINIVFPYNTWGGAFRSTYELANRMKESGNDVEIYFPFFPYLEGEKLFSWQGIKLIFRGIIRSTLRRNKIPWFDVNVKINLVPFIKNRYIRDADVIIANHWPTAFSVHQLSKSKGEKFYFIRDTEPWSKAYNLELEAFRLPLKKIVTLTWIKEFLEKEVDQSVVGIVPNGINPRDFEVKNKKYNNPPTISMIYSTHPAKGIPDGLEVLEQIKKQFSEVKILLFGFTKPPKLNFIFEFHHRPVKEELKEIYAKSDIFLCPSLQEGWNNPPREAMLAECAVVATSAGSIPECTIPGETAFVVEPGDKKSMIESIAYLINNPIEIQKMGKSSKKQVMQFTWENSTNTLIDILNKHTK